MKKLLSIALTLLLLLSSLPIGTFGIVAAAETNGYYTYTVTDGKATITDVDTAISGAVTVPSTINGYTVTAIGNHAFNGCSSVTSVVLPDTITSIGGYAFYDCGMTSINIPEGVTTIGSYAFFSTNIKTLSIPKSVISIGSGIVGGCHYITAINVDAANTKYSSTDGVLFNKDKTKLITYPMKKGLAEYTVPEGVTTIGNAAFKDTPSTLKKVNLPSTLTTIDVDGFRYCIGLTDIVIPNGVKTINTTAFYSCTKLATLTLPKTVTTIGGNAFSLCSALKTIYYLGSETDYASITIGENPILSSATWYYNSCVGTTTHTYTNECDAFCNVCEFKRDKAHTYDSDADAVCNVCGENRYLVYTITNGEATITDIDSALSGAVTIPETMGGVPVVAIGEKAFNGGTAVTSVALPSTVKTIGAYAFYNTGITSMDIPEGVTSIGNYAFANNASLKTLNVSSTVTSIGTAVVLNCGAIQNIIVDDNNASYCSVNGVLFNKSKTTIVIYPQGKTATSYEIPDGVTVIGGSSFKNCIYLKNISIPESVTKINGEAFSNCKNVSSFYIPSNVVSISSKAFYYCVKLEKITISKSVTTIGANAFLYDSAITDVYYRGSEADYSNLSVNAEGNTTLTSAAWHYNSCIGSATHTYDNDCDTDCNVCGDIREVGDHIYDNACDAFCNICDTQREVSDHIYDNDCDTNCNICGAVRTVNGHVYDFDCDAFCNVCGYERTPAAHKYDNDCDTDCNDCGAKRTITHTYDDSSDLYCNVCGDLRYLSYTVLNKQVTITDCENFFGQMHIPSEINGYPVTKIGDRAFENCNSIEKIIIPNSVTSVGANAFDGCSNIYELTIPGSITKIADFAFYSIVNLRTLTIEKGVTTIGNYAFSQCVSLTGISIPDSVISIGGSAFSDCRSIKTLEIGKGVKSIGQDAFRNCGYLTSITVDEENQSYSGKGNCLVEKSSGTLIRGCKNSVIPADGSVTSIADYAFYSYYGYFGDNPEALEFFVIPNGVTYIGEYAFSGFGIKKLVLPEGLTAIEKLAFYDCDRLTEIVWPSTLKYIKDSVFKDCRYVTDVWFCGDVDNYIAIEYTGTYNHYVYSGTATWHLNICKNGKHTYTNGCADAICSECEWSKLPTDHIFDDECDAECNVCGLTVREPNHIYDNTCDTTCNNCGEVRAITHSYVSVVTKPTCTKEGYTTNTCSVCGEVSVDTVVAPLGHTPSEAVIENKKESTCTEHGSYDSVVYCSVCNEELSREGKILPLADHSLIAHESKAPTCTEIGWNAYETCSECDYTTYLELPAKGHTKGEPVVENKVEATCTAEGSYDSVVYCSVCNEELSREGKIIPLAHHSLITHEAKAPNCTEIGWEAYVTCANCDYTTYEEIPENGHIEGEIIHEDIRIPTCHTEGEYVMYAYCEVCGEEVFREYFTGPPLEHVPSLEVVENEIPATCTVNGSYDNVIYCDLCGDELERNTVTIDATGHTVIEHEGKEPTCTEIGWNAYETCSECDYTTYVELPAKGHTEDDPIIENDVEPTCTKDGSYDVVIYCTDCGKELFRDSYTVPALEHLADKPVAENTVEPTCTASGSYDSVVYCARCDEELSRETVTLPATGHKYDNACDTACNNCGEVRTITHTFTADNDIQCDVCGEVRYITYTVANGTVTITGVDKTLSGTITIPSVINGYNVTAIGDKAFNACTKLAGVVLPDTITTIGTYAFYDCSMTSVNIPEGVLKIGSYAFFSTNIKVLNIPKTVTSIGSGVVEGCHYITAINVDEANEYYSSVDGVLFDKAVTKLIAYPKAKGVTEYTVPEGVTVIGNAAFKDTSATLKKVNLPSTLVTIDVNAFRYCVGLTDIVIPVGVKTISTTAFYSCTKLKTVTLPKTITSIGGNAFSLCNALETVYYMGSEDDYTTIKFEKENDKIISAKWYYNSCINCAEHTYDNALDGECNVCGSVREVAEYIKGDIDGDTVTNLNDLVTIAQYVAGWKVEVNEKALDVNGDGKVDLSDVNHLSRYLAGWPETELF